MALTSFYDHTNPYGGQAWHATFPGWHGSEAWHQMVENDIGSGWTRRLSEVGLGGLDDRSGAARALYSRMAEGLAAARLTNPALRAWDYMQGLDPRALLGGLSPSQKGQISARFTGGMTRWGQRPY